MNNRLYVIFLLSFLLLFSCKEQNVKLSSLVNKEQFKVEPTHDTIVVRCTYYYTPIIENVKDYGMGEGTIINYKGKNLRLYLPTYASDIIAMEGFAILVCNTESLQGRYLINSNYEIRPYIEGSEGNKLRKGELAVDNDLIAHGASIYIKELKQYSKAADVGSAIKGSHVDYNLGEGNALVMQKKANKMPEKLTLIIKRV